MNTMTDVTEVELIEGYTVWLKFDDNSERTVDLTRFIERGGIFAEIAVPDKFAEVYVDEMAGTIVWPNGADLAPEVLHGDFEPAWATEPEMTPS